MKKIFTLIAVAALLATVTTGCLSVKTTETVAVVKQEDGSYTTNYTKVVLAKHQDPLKDKWVRFTESMVGLRLNVSPAPTGVSGGLSPLSLVFGKQKLTWDTLPIYPGVATGYTPPIGIAASGAGSLWNDSDTENMSSQAGILPPVAYTPSVTTPVNLLVQTTGAVAAPPVATTPTAGVVTNAVPVVPITTTNAP
jgi:hypothetical protein